MTALEPLTPELRSAVRMSWRRSGNSFIAVVTLGLGLGLSTVMFSFVYSDIFRAFPVPGGDRIIHLEDIRPGARLNLFSLSIHDLRDLKRSQTSFDALGGYRRLGRIFLPADVDTGAPVTVVLGFRRWMAQYAGDPSVVGMATRVNGEDATIIGVMSDGFRFPFDQDLWVPDRVDLHSLGRGGGPNYDLPVVIVNESFVRRFLPDQKTIGRRFGSAGLTEEEPWLTIVGVVPDLWMGGVDNQDQPPDGFYRPYTQTGSRFLWIPASVPGDPTAQVGTLWAEVAALGPESPLDDTQSLDDTLRADLNLQYTMGGLFGVFGLVALLLTALGLHGSVEFVTNRHTREIGVRVPLDAGSSRVIRMVIGQTSGYVVLGVLAGLGLGEFVSRSLGLFIVQEQSWDLSLHRGIILVLCAGTLTASLIPALMATRIPPSEALRWEYGKGPLNHGRDP